MKSNCCNTKKSLVELSQVAEFLKIISEKNRLKIFCLLKEKDMCVCDIWQHLDLAQNLTSHHLKVLKDFGLIKSKKESTNVIYSLNAKNTEKYIKLLSHYI